MGNEFHTAKTTSRKDKVFKKTLDILLNMIGSSILAFGICAFVEPFGLIVGGATGISLVVHRIFGINVSTVALIINLGVLPLGYLFGGKKMVLGSVLSSIVFPLALRVCEQFPQITTIADNAMLATLCGGLVCGFGIGLVMRSGSSTGGTDIPCLAISKLTHISIDQVINITDTIIMLCQIPISGLTNIIYGILYTYLMTHALGSAIAFGEDRLRISVISEKYEEIRQELIANDFGVTTLLAESGYTRTPILKIESVLRSSQYRKAQDAIEKVDPTSFITIEHVKDVKGRGFTMKREWIDMN